MVIKGSVLLKEIAKGSGIPQKDIKIIWNNLLEGVCGHLKKGEVVVLPKIGKLYVRRLEERSSMNPKTGERIIAKAKNIIKFFPFPLLKEVVNEKLDKESLL